VLGFTFVRAAIVLHDGARIISVFVPQFTIEMSRFAHWRECMGSLDGEVLCFINVWQQCEAAETSLAGDITLL
jgi:hypothetical protein